MAHLKGQPDVQAALTSLPDLGARTKYLAAVFDRLAHHADALASAALVIALGATDLTGVLTGLAPAVGIVLAKAPNNTRRDETIERDGAAMRVPAAIANLLREAATFEEVDADVRAVEKLQQLLPELTGLLVEDVSRKGSTRMRRVYRANDALKGRIRLV